MNTLVKYDNKKQEDILINNGKKIIETNEFLKDLTNKVRSLILILLVDICKFSIENFLLINDLKDIFVFIYSSSNFFLLKKTSG